MGVKLLVGGAGVFGMLVLIGMCSEAGSRGSTAQPGTGSTSGTVSSFTQAPAVTHADSVRLRQRAKEIVRQNRSSGWAEADLPRMNARADTVVFFGDTTDSAVRTWIRAKRHADEQRIVAQAEAAGRQADAAKWSYSTATDPMAGRASHTASIESENTVEFGFPYEGAQHGTLWIRNHPSYGHDVFLTIERGQILCHSFDECTVRVRFDDGPAERWSGAEPSDNNTTTIFIRNYSRFVERMRHAKVVRVQIPVYQEGDQTFEFRVDGFDNGRYTSGS
jgi:hypothetical protein